MSHRISEASTVFSCYLPPYHLNSSYPRTSDFQTICLEGVIKTPVETEVCWPQYVGPGKNFVWATKKNNSDTIHWILVGCSSNVAGALLWCPLCHSDSCGRRFRSCGSSRGYGVCSHSRCRRKEVLWQIQRTHIDLWVLFKPFFVVSIWVLCNCWAKTLSNSI